MQDRPEETDIEQRKADHIDLAFQSQTGDGARDPRFYYEPMLARHPDTDATLTRQFLGKTMQFPIWISSMTGGTELARHINENLARVCAEFGLGMGLGSCRVLLEEDTRRSDFAMRSIIGPELPFYANLGIAQVHELVKNRQISRVVELVETLEADGLIVHINPLQEWLQPEGDQISQVPLETIRALLEESELKIIVKEVGQGMGPLSISALMQLPLEAIEFAAHGGTNFAMLELLRSSPDQREAYVPLAGIGHSAGEMIEFVNGCASDLGETLKCRQIIVSGGVRSFLDGFYFMNKLNLPSIYGQASEFLKYAREDYATLRNYAQTQIQGLKLANAYLKVK